MTLKNPAALASYALSNAAGVSTAPECVPSPASAREKARQTGWLTPSGSHRSHGEGEPAGRRSHGRGWVHLAYGFMDICCVVASGVIAFYLRFYLGFYLGFSLTDSHGILAPANATIGAGQPLSRYGGFLFVYVVLILLFSGAQNLYRTPRTRSAWEESVAVAKAVSFATLLLTAFLYLSRDAMVSRTIVLTSLLLNFTALAAWRYTKRRIVIRRVEQGFASRNVAIVGAGVVGQALARQLEENKHLGYCFKGFLDQNHSEDPRTLGTIAELSSVVRAKFIDEVFITIPSERELVKRIAAESRRHHLDVKVVPELYDGLAWHAPIFHIGDFPLMDLEWRPIPTLGLFIKRVLDVLLSAMVLIVVSPVLLALLAWTALDSPGPLLYRSRRVGWKGRIFVCYKLRTMVANADDLKDALRERNQRHGPCFKIANDPRVTRLGKCLRKYSVDELPQLWNVLKGDMSLVGPRPHPLDDYRQYDLDHLRRLDVKPGITGLWQVRARRDPSFETNMALDIEYIDCWTLLLDLKLMLATVPTIFKGMGQ